MAWISAAASAPRSTAIHTLVSINHPTDRAAPIRARVDPFVAKRSRPTGLPPFCRQAYDRDRRIHSTRPDAAPQEQVEQSVADFARGRPLLGRVRARQG